MNTYLARIYLFKKVTWIIWSLTRILSFCLDLRGQYWKFIAQLPVVNNMCIQSTWAYPLIVQAVADASNVSIQTVKSNLGFSPNNTVNLVQEQIACPQ